MRATPKMMRTVGTVITVKNKPVYIGNGGVACPSTAYAISLIVSDLYAG